MLEGENFFLMNFLLQDLTPVVPADDSFIRSHDLPDVLQTPIIDNFSRPLTKIKQIPLKLHLKNLKHILKKKICLSHWQNIFQILMRFLKKIKKNEGNQDVIENLEEILSNID